MFKKISFLFLSFLFSISIFYGQLISVNNDVEELPLEPYTEVFKTKNDSLLLSEISPSLWKKSDQGSNFGMVDKIHWLKYEFENLSSDSVSLYFYTPYHHIRSIELYFTSKKDTSFIAEYGTTKYYYKKEIETPGYSKKITFPSGKSSLFIKIKHQNIPLRANSYLLSKSRVKSVIKTSETSFRIWRTILTLAFFIALIAYVTTRIKIFLYYLILNVGIILFIGIEIGEFFIFFNIDKHYNLIDLKHLGDILVLFTFPYFLNELTPIKKLNPKAWKFMFNLIKIGAFVWFIGLFPGMKETVFFFYSVVYLIIITVIVFYGQLYFLLITLIKKQKNSLLLFILYVAYIAAVTYEVVLPNIGSKSDNILVYNVLLKTSIVEVFFFLVLMGKEMLSIFKDRDNLLIKQKELQKDMLKAVVSSQETERNTLGRELHDMIGANMSVVKQNLDKSNPNLIKIMDETIDSVRSLSHGLMTPNVENEELKNEILDLCLLCSSDKMKVNYYFHDWKPMKNKENSTHLYRIIQELLQNAIKHSNADEVYIQFINKDKLLTILYEDNGIGFDTKKEKKKGKGLLGIKHRVEILKAKIRYESSDKGTSIEINIEI